MGTSASSSGPGGNTPLVPSWLDNSPASPSTPLLPQQPIIPATNLGNGIPPTTIPTPGTPLHPNLSSPVPGTSPGVLPNNNIPAGIPPNRFQTARINFTKFSKSGGRDRRALGRSIRSYVSRANGGAAKASQRMGASRTAAANIVDVLARLQRDGIQQTLQHFNLDAAFAASPQDTFIALTDVICGADGGLVDEAIARDAWCEIAAGIDQFGISDLGAMTDSQRREVFAGFVGKTIELRILNDMGDQGFKIAGSSAELRQINDSLAVYIRAATRDEIMSQYPQNLSNITTSQLQTIGSTVYDRAWAILETYRVR